MSQELNAPQGSEEIATTAPSVAAQRPVFTTKEAMAICEIHSAAHSHAPSIR
jgi:hypothetical protein